MQRGDIPHAEDGRTPAELAVVAPESRVGARMVGSHWIWGGCEAGGMQRGDIPHTEDGRTPAEVAAAAFVRGPGCRTHPSPPLSASYILFSESPHEPL